MTTFWPDIEAGLAIAHSPETGPDLRLAAAESLAGEGLFNDMAPIAESLAALPATAAGGRRLKMICRQFERWGLHRRLTPYGDPQADPERAAKTRSALFLRRDGSRDCVIVFVGDASLYWVSLYMLERILPTDRHILFLKDPDRIGFTLGTPGLSSRHDQMAPALCRFLAGIGVERFHVLGTSSGGFSALHFARTAGAAGALALSPWTTAAPLIACLQADAPADVRDDIARRAPVQPDLAALFDGPQSLPLCPLLLTYGADHVVDRLQSERLSGSPGVALNPLADCAQHDILGPLIASGAITGLLERLFDVA